MSGLYKFVIFIAALSLIATSARVFWIGFDVRTHLARTGLIGVDDPAVRLGEGAQGQFLTASPDGVRTVRLWSRDPETGEVVEGAYTAAPMFYQDAGKVLPDERALWRWRRSPNRMKAGKRADGLPARVCPARYAGDILVYDHQTEETQFVFGEGRRAIVRLQAHRGEDGGAVYVRIDYAAADTDGDGQLTCNDKLSLALFEAPAGVLHEIDFSGGEPVFMENLYGEDWPLLSVGVDENGDGYHDYTRERVRFAKVDLETMTMKYLTP